MKPKYATSEDNRRLRRKCNQLLRKLRSTRAELERSQGIVSKFMRDGLESVKRLTRERDEAIAATADWRERMVKREIAAEMAAHDADPVCECGHTESKHAGGKKWAHPGCCDECQRCARFKPRAGGAR